MNNHSQKTSLLTRAAIFKQCILLLSVIFLTSVSCSSLQIAQVAAADSPDSESSAVMGIDDPGWTRFGVVMDLGNKGDYDDKNIESPLVLKLGSGDYVMWYRGQTYADTTGRVMRAVSSDGIKWRKTGVVMIPTEAYEGNKIDPMTVIFEDGIYKMWYGGTAYGGCACYATSVDGIKWIKYSANPVLRKTSGLWDNEGAGGQLAVMKIGDTYHMYYKGYGKSVEGWTFYGLAESQDGIAWMKKGKVISPQPEIGETTVFKNLTAFKLGDKYAIMHTMSDYLHLFLCTSDDGRVWEKKGVVYRHGLSPYGADQKWATSPCIAIENGLVRMWYEGGDGNGRVRTLYAEIEQSKLLQFHENVMLVRAAD